MERDIADSGIAGGGGAAPVAPSTTVSGPIQERERLDSLDLIRGVAVLGILLININSFGLPSYAFARPWIWGHPSSLDLWVFALNAVFVQGKFYGLFSVLFGAGLAMQLSRYESRGLPVESTALRRLAFLFILGVAHAVFLWNGDILNWYAMAGAVVLLMRPLSSGVLLALAGLFCLVPGLFCVLGILGSTDAFGGLSSGASAESFPASFEMAARHADLDLVDRLAEMIAVTPVGVSLEADLYANGPYWMATLHRGVSLLEMLVVFLIMMAWPILAFMLLGMVLWRAGFFQSGRIMGLEGWSGPVVGLAGLLAGGVAAVLMVSGSGEAISGVGELLLLYASFILVPVYLIGLVAWCRHPWPRWLTRQLCACGRMALSNYLLQSLVMSFVFFSQGLGLMGRFGYAGLLPFVLGMWLVQLLVSPWWLTRHEYGPAEWLWRCATYARWLPLAKSRPVAM